MSFGTLALICLVGTLGPILALPRRGNIPVVIGELAAGLLLGSTGANWLHAQDRTFTFLSQLGFALVMFVAGSHVPVRDARLWSALRVGTLRALAVGAVASVLGWSIAAAFHTGHAGVYAVLMASSSAAVALPILDSMHLDGANILSLVPQIAIADTVCIVALPLVLDPGRAGRAALGAAAVIGAAAVVYVVLRHLERTGIQRRVHRLSEARKFALELRINLTILFALAALAATVDVSIMLAGFSFGLVVAAIGEPRRLARQLFALNDGFLAPLFFVWLGAGLQVRALIHRPSYVLLGVALAGGALLAHWAMRLAGQPIYAATLAATQLGVPVAAVTLGTQLHIFRTGEQAALLFGALLTLAASSLAMTRIKGKNAGPEG